MGLGLDLVGGGQPTPPPQLKKVHIHIRIYDMIDDCHLGMHSFMCVSSLISLFL